MRRDVEFLSEGIPCRGWLYTPDDLDGRAPAIVMANAISAVKEITLPGYAERFAKAGFVVLVFDYRHYGASDGEPLCWPNCTSVLTSALYSDLLRLGCPLCNLPA